MKACRSYFHTLVLLCLLSPFSVHAGVCDVDDDGDVDIDDIQSIIAAVNQPPGGPSDPRDSDGDGRISVLDARTCVVQCTLPGCARPASNRAPVAEAGPDQTAFVGATVTLNGGGSSDADGDPLTFAWSLSVPAGSAATLSDPVAVAPTFVVDAPGDYIAQLIVNDGLLDSAADSLTVSTLNSAPVADAGPDQSAFVGETVTLNGGGSSDVDGDPLTFAWSLSPPPGSAATLSDPAAVSPTFVVDLPGDYIAQLIVNDGLLDSASDPVTVSTLNSAPIANAGPDQSAFVGDIVTLNGGGSSDVDGDPLTFAWSLSAPPGSSAALSDPGAVAPTFSVDLPGDYVAQLIVNDGLVDSAPDTISVSTLNSAPVANAGPDQSAFVNDLVSLNGGGSSDADGDPLTFAWSLSAPAGSSATLSDPGAVAPTFVIDLPGDYLAQLVVNDGLVGSAPDTITVSTLNSAPLANAGPDQSAFVGETVTLSGAGSTDVDGDPLTFAWSLSPPPGSAATLSDPSAVSPTFVVDIPGDYVAQLIVNDGFVDSAADTITVSTLNSAPVADAGPDQSAFVLDTVTLNGAGSSDVDGDPLTFAWSLSPPPGSAATLSDPAAVSPTFVIDLPGDYVAQLVVNDGLVGSLADTIIVSTLNSAPVANAGADQTARVSDTVNLDGSGSTDVDGDPLTFGWSLSLPPGSSAALSDPTAVAPTFTVDAPGDYVVQLIVNDGLVDSAPDTATVSTENSPPVADAGADQTAFVLDIVTLDGSGSSDVDGDPLSFLWSLSPPAGSAAALSSPLSVAPSFVVDVPGDYVVQLIVDDGLVASPPDTVMVSTENSAPVAHAGPDQNVFVLDIVTLDGSASSDVDGDPLTYFWSLTRPPGSTAIISDPLALGPTFVADVIGDYVAQLIVNDGTVDSPPDTSHVTVSVLPILSVTDSVTLEGGPGATPGLEFDVVLTPASSVPVTVEVQTLAQTAAAGVDFQSVAPTVLTFAPGETSKTVSVTVLGDDVVELDEDFLLQLTNPVNAAIVSANGTGTISNDDAATLAIDDITLAEGDAGAFDFVFTVTLDNAVDAGLTVDFASLDGSATLADSDYAAATGTLVFSGNAGETQLVAVAVNGDTTVELDEGFSLLLSNLQAGGRDVILADDTGLATIGNDDIATLVIDDVSQVEGNAGATDFVFTVSLDNAVDTGFSVDFASLDGSAMTADADYAAAGGTLDFLGTVAETQNVTVTVNGDITVELDETFSLLLSNLQAGGRNVILSDANGLGTIGNDDAATLGIDDVTIAEGDAGTTDFVFTVTLDGAVGTGLTVDYASLDGSATLADGDYVAATGTLNFTGVAGETQNVSVAVSGDTIVEPNEDFSLLLSNLQAAGQQVTLADDTGVGTILNDDSVTIDIGDVSQAEGDAGSSQFQFDLTLTGSTAIPVSVTADTADGSATAGSDYVALAGVTIDFAPGQTASSVLVEVPGDGDPEPGETFLVNLSTAQPGVVFGDAQGEGTIANDDAALSIDDVSRSEGDAGKKDYVFTVSIEHASVLAVSASAQTADGTATAGSGDYDALGATPVNIPAGNTSTTVTVQINGDTDPEPDENFFVDLSAPTNASLADPQGEGTIVNDDAALPGIGLSVIAGGPPVGVTRSATVRVTLAQPAPAGGLSVTVTSDAPSILGVAGPGTIAIAAGNSTGTITVNGNGEGSTALRANASGYAEGSLLVPVTLNLITIPETLSVPLGQTTSLPVSITPNPAPAGGLLIQLNGTNSAAVDIQTSSVTIPAGQFSANATVFGVAPGNSTVIATNPSYAPDSGVVTTSADLNILQSSLTINDTLPDDLNIQLEVGGSPVSAPAPGITIAVTSDNPGCVAASSPVVIGSGLVNTTSTLSYGGSASLPCGANVTVSAPGITSDTVPVTVNPAPGITLFGLPRDVGAGLQDFCCTARLGATQHGGVTVRIESLDPSVALVSPNPTTPGAPFIDVFLNNGGTDVSYVVQGLEGQVGNVADIQASAPGFVANTGTVSVVQPAVDIVNLGNTLDTLDPDDPFNVRVGVGNASGITRLQAVRVGGTGPLEINVDNSVAAVGDLVTSALVADSVTVEIAAGSSASPSSVVTGGVAFQSVSAGVTTVTASAPGFFTTGNGSKSVTVTNPIITTFGYPATVGAGLQDFCCTARLGATQHGGVTMRIESLNPSVALVSPNASTPGSAFIDVVVANGSTDVSYYLQGVEGQAGGVATIEASAPGFGSVSASVSVVQPSLDISSLGNSLDTLDPDDHFFVRVGVGNGTGLVDVQAVRAGAPGPLVINVDNSVAAVGDLVTNALIADSVTVEIAVGSSASPASVATGGVAFQSVSAGVTTVAATAPGLFTTTNGSRSVTVTNPVITTFGIPTSVGAGLQDLCCTARLGATQHGGVTMRIESLDPSVALVSPNAVTAGTAFIEVFVPNGSTDVSYVVHGLEGQAGNAATIEASAPGFGSVNGSVSVVQPSLDILGLETSIDTLDPDDAFQLRIGIGTAVSISDLQAVRIGAPTPLVATITSSMPGIGRLVTSALTGASVTVEIAPGQSVSPSSVAVGGVGFEPLTSGMTLVSASIPGFITTANGNRNVTVTTPTISMSGLPATVGSGLQLFCCTAQLSATDHGGVDVTLTSSNPAVALIAPDPTSPGVTSFTTNLANGERNVSYVVQGLEGALGTVQIVAEASGFLDGSGTLTVVQPALDILNLNLAPGAGASDDPFTIRIGLPTATTTSLQRLQSIRIGGVAATVTITSSDPAVGQLVTTPLTAGTVTVSIDPGDSASGNTVVNGGVAFDPLSQGSTTVEATIPGFITTGNGSRLVTVGP